VAANTAAGASPSTGAIVNGLTAGGSPLCLDVPNGNYSAGTKLVIWTCNGGSNQQFTATDAGELRIGGLCVDAFNGGSTGADMGLWGCHGGANQKWVLRPDGHYVGDGGFCMAVSANKTQAGTPVIMWNCEAANPGQTWTGPVSSP
jgi:hypothetical protein